MGSIYKKGRDGYYYYQAYIYNKETGKKNKKIFHSLGTKSFDEAQKQKIELDKKYSRQSYEKIKTGIGFNQSKVFIFFGSITSLLILFLFINNINFKNNDIPKIQIHEQKKISHFNEKSDNSIHLKSKSDRLEKNNQIKVKSLDSLAFSNNDSNNKEILSSYADGFKYKAQSKNDFIPAFKIQREEQISGSFNQLKLYVTCLGNVNEESLLNLCKSLKKDYSNYINIIICVYHDPDIGTMLSEESYKNFNNKASISDWLFFYTFNPVEGEFYDFNPENYLGAN